MTFFYENTLSFNGKLSCNQLRIWRNLFDNDVFSRWYTYLKLQYKWHETHTEYTYIRFVKRIWIFFKTVWNSKVPYGTLLVKLMSANHSEPVPVPEPVSHVCFYLCVPFNWISRDFPTDSAVAWFRSAFLIDASYKKVFLIFHLHTYITLLSVE